MCQLQQIMQIISLHFMHYDNVIWRYVAKTDYNCINRCFQFKAFIIKFFIPAFYKVPLGISEIPGAVFFPFPDPWY